MKIQRNGPTGPVEVEASALVTKFDVGFTVEKPIRNLPVGAKVRLRLRWGELPSVFVKSGNSIAWYRLFDDGNGGWIIAGLKSVNATRHKDSDAPTPLEIIRQ